MIFPYRVPLAMPYWNGGTYRRVFRSVLRGDVIAGPDLVALRSLVIETLGVAEARLCGSGSLGLEIALRACGVHAGDEVVIPTFTCTSVILPVLALGAVPVLADVGEELNLTAETVEPVLTRKTKAIVVPHLFGNPAEINVIIGLATSRGINVIDDAAQAVGATIDGAWVGSFGDAGVLSFGAEKVCFGLGGGVVVSRRKEILGDFKNVMARPRFSTCLYSLLSTVVWRRWRRWTGPVQAALFSARTKGPDLPPRPYSQESMANLSAAVALSLMRTLGENIAARRARMRAYQELLGAEGRLTLISHRPGSACLTQVVRIRRGSEDGDYAAELIGALRGAGYEVQGSYVPIHFLPGYEAWARAPLPRAERVWPDLIELPCEPEVSLDDVERIAFIVKQALKS